MGSMNGIIKKAGYTAGLQKRVFQELFYNHPAV